ncbi:transporter substrate-binding domain-containing protein [Aromatoleum toluvorans]|uniref:Transporter substrate-binding domain-containing protein n=1 Tax=Aromatoleum toluvorans TaxID=92002 RepID=A0ABX1PY42_9RHOO|nr:ABC transporter substrate-binding protein [Aromatoleum toluvorans]NMG44371.1 transporter substrate-binding domain-containing protein [Aromatoleum toluvorans]
MLRPFARAFLVAAALVACLIAPASAADPAVIRIGVLQYGTVSWELEVMKRMGFAEREGVRIEVVPLAQKDAANVALQGGAVDLIVNDWIWVARQRAEGRDFAFVPYSRAVGGIMVRPDANLRSLADLRGQRLGVAGGALDKSWLLLRAWSRKSVGEDAATFVKPDFGAPPLLNALILKGEIPAVLNFWHFSARLRAAGMRELLTLDDILKGLGVEGELPMIGWVFREDWAAKHRAAFEGFLRAGAQARRHMQTSDAVWEELRPLTRAEDDATLVALRDGFRAGIPGENIAQAERTAQRIFGILAAEGGAELVGNATALPAGTFWRAGGSR